MAKANKPKGSSDPIVSITNLSIAKSDRCVSIIGNAEAFGALSDLLQSVAQNGGYNAGEFILTNDPIHAEDVHIVVRLVHEDEIAGNEHLFFNL